MISKTLKIRIFSWLLSDSMLLLISAKILDRAALILLYTDDDVRVSVMSSETAAIKLDFSPSVRSLETRGQDMWHNRHLWMMMMRKGKYSPMFAAEEAVEKENKIIPIPIKSRNTKMVYDIGKYQDYNNLENPIFSGRLLQTNKSNDSLAPCFCSITLIQVWFNFCSIHKIWLFDFRKRKSLSRRVLESFREATIDIRNNPDSVEFSNELSVENIHRTTSIVSKLGRRKSEIRSLLLTSFKTTKMTTFKRQVKIIL